MLEDQHAVGCGDRQGTARSAFTDNGGDHRGRQAEAAFGGAGNGLALAAFLGADAGIGPGGVDEGDDRKAELLCHVHQAHGLAVALGPGHAEIVLQARGGVVALFMTHHHHGHAAEAPEAADHRLVVGELSVSAKLHELLDEAADIVDDLGLLPGVQARIGLAAEVIHPMLQCRQFLIERAGTGGVREPGKLFNLGLEVVDRTLEVEVMSCCGGHAVLGCRWRKGRKLGAIGASRQGITATRPSQRCHRPLQRRATRGLRRTPNG